MKAKNTFGDVPDQTHAGGHWVDAFRSECIDELNKLAAENGVKVISLEVMDRKLDGHLGAELEKEAEQVLSTQIKVHTRQDDLTI
jgi:hypothetical protein